MSENERIIGDHDARIAHLERRIESIEGDIKEVLAILNKAKGGWVAIVGISSIAGAVGAGAIKFLATVVK